MEKENLGDNYKEFLESIDFTNSSKLKQFYISFFKSYPDSYLIENILYKEVYKVLIKNNFKSFSSSKRFISPTRNNPDKIESRKSLPKKFEKIKILLKEHQNKKKPFLGEEVETHIFYNNQLKSFVLYSNVYHTDGELYYYYSSNGDKNYENEKIIKKLKGTIKRKDDSNQREVNFIFFENNRYSLKPFNVDNSPINLELNYGSSIINFHEKVVNDLNSKKKGLIFLYGEPGGGKTFYIRNLTSIINKKFIYIPPNLVESVSSPAFLSFLMQHQNSILIIEEGENIIKSRDVSDYSSQSVHNLLSISDGLLGDLLNIKIIITFNSKKSKIDPALMREGRLIAEHEFKELTIEESKKLVEHLGLNFEVNKPMMLTEIYNEKDKSIRENDNKNTIGFKR